MNYNFFAMASSSPAFDSFSCSNDDQPEQDGAKYIGSVSNMIKQTSNKRVIRFYVSNIDDNNKIDLKSFIPGRKRDYQFIVTGGHVHFSCDMNISNVANSITFSRLNKYISYNFVLYQPEHNKLDPRKVCPMDFVTINDALFPGVSASTDIMPYVKGDQNAINANAPSNFNDLYPLEGADTSSGVIEAIPASTFDVKTRCIITTPGTHDSYKILYDFGKPSKKYKPFIFRAAPGSEERPTTITFYEKEDQIQKLPQGDTDFCFYFENYQDLTLDMASVKQYRGSIRSYLSQYNFDNCGKITFTGNDATTPNEFEIQDALALGNINYGVVIISPKVYTIGSGTYDATWVKAKNFSVSANMRPTIINITVTEGVSIDSSTVFFEGCTLEKDIQVDIKKTESWWPSISLQKTQLDPRSITIDLGITASSSHLLDSSEEYESHSLITGIDSNKCEILRDKTTISNKGKFALECSNDKTELIVIKGKENAPVLSPEGGEDPTPGGSESDPEKPSIPSSDDGGEIKPPQQSSDDGGEVKPPQQSSDDGEIPVITPQPVPTKEPESVDSITIDKDEIESDELTTKLNEKFDEMTGEGNKVLIVDAQTIHFNTELDEKQFIKPAKDSTVNYEGGNLHLVIPENVNIVLTNNENSNLLIKGEGSVNIKLKEDSTNTELINLNTKSQINGTVTITVPKTIEEFKFDSIELDSEGKVNVKREEGEDADSKPIKLSVKNVNTVSNSNAELSDITIETSLNIVQSSVLKVENVAISQASINYKIYDFMNLDKDKPFFNGKFNSFPRSLTLTKIQGGKEKPTENDEYQIVSGIFDNVKCNDWLPGIALANSGFNLKECINNDPTLDSENQRIVLKYDPSYNPDDGKDDGKLGPGPIAGIVIGVIVAVAIIVVVVVIVIKRKKNNMANSSENEDANNGEKDDI